MAGGKSEESSAAGRVGAAALGVGLAALACLVLLEMGVRVLGLAQPFVEAPLYVADPDLVYRPQPDGVFVGRSALDEFDYDYRHNPFGFRDVARSVAKPDGSFRILGLGDSFTYGIGVGFESTWLHRLEDLLAKRPGAHPPVEVLNFGVPRFFPELERRLLESQGLGLEPDLVLVAFVPNDVIDTHLGLGAVGVGPEGHLLSTGGLGLLARLPSGTLALYRRSHLVRSVLSLAAGRLGPASEPTWWDDVYREGGRHEDDWRAAEAELSALFAAAGEHGAGGVLLHIPQKPTANDDAYPARRLARLAERERVLFVDALPPLRRAAQQEPVYWARDGHCNDAGARVIAETLFAALVAEGIAP